MKRRFKSKLGLLIVPLLVLLIAAEAYTVWTNNWIGMVSAGVPAVFIIYLYFSTLYVVTKDEKLKIKSGFLYHKEIYIKSIKKVRPTKNHGASPALSFDRLEISYNRYGRVIVSPNRKSEFIKELKEVNPRINVE
jgi:Bacterial PH domain